MYKIEHYLTHYGQKDVYLGWLAQLGDQRAKVAIIRRVIRIENGNFGDHRYCRNGVWELRIDISLGYRVYYALSGHQLVLLLGGGNKRTQAADIERSVLYWQDWQRRSEV